MNALDASCSELNYDEDEAVPRSRLVKAKELADIQKPCIHFGNIASSDTVMKWGEERDKIAAKEKVIAFKMEGSGIWVNFPCVVIKGVCDYTDSDKNRTWVGLFRSHCGSLYEDFFKINLCR